MSDQPSSVSTPQEVRATFASPDQMQDAVSKLSLSGFDRADLSVPSRAVIQGTETPEAGTEPAYTDEDARQSRTLGASTAAAAAAMAAAGVTIATGGAAAPAIAAAVVAGGAAGGSIFAVHDAANRMEQTQRDDRASTGSLLLTVRAPTAAKLSEAQAILRAAGATEIETIA